MNLEKYDFREIDDKKSVSYVFLSTGTKGNILKLVSFQAKNSFEYNLALGDIDQSTGEADFQVSSNNGDIKKVMSTIMGIGLDFFKNYPNSVVGFAGNQERKTKFYQRIIRNNLSDLLQYFVIYGVLSLSEIEIFNPEIEYFGFYFKLKK